MSAPIIQAVTQKRADRADCDRDRPPMRRTLHPFAARRAAMICTGQLAFGRASLGDPFNRREGQAVPYFNWDAPVSNAEVRSALLTGTEEEKLFWIARILGEARYADVWRYPSLTDDVLPRWDRVRTRLGRRRALWEYLIAGFRHDGLIQ